MSRFYNGAAKIEAWIDRPQTSRFLDALSMWWLVGCVITLIAMVTALVVVAILAVAGVL